MTRRRRLLLILAALLMLLAGTLHWATRPERVTAALLDRVGAVLGLEITADGIGEYRLGGGPHIVVRDLVARQPGAPAPLLHARRIALSLPWSTVRARGADLTITRVELDDPVLDLQALRRWQATRPPTDEARVPTLTEGLQVRGGRLLGDGWAVHGIAITLPSLHPDRAVRGDIRGRVETGAVRVPFDLAVALSRPSADADAQAHGTIAVHGRDWQLPMRLQATGRLRLDADVPGIDALRIGADAAHVRGTSRTPFVLGMAGDLRFAQGVSLRPAGVALRGSGAVPNLDAAGAISWGNDVGLALEGALARWPQAWPALPPPIGRPATAVPLVLGYDGPPDLSGPTSLQLVHGATSVDADLRLPQVLAWLEDRGDGSPLPPASGRLRTPELRIAGATLEGVQIEIEPSAAETAQPSGPGLPDAQ